MRKLVINLASCPQLEVGGQQGAGKKGKQLNIRVQCGQKPLTLLDSVSFCWLRNTIPLHMEKSKLLFHFKLIFITLLIYP